MNDRSGVGLFIISFPVSLGSHVDVQYVVDFAPELYEIITETKYMEQLGFHVPELARNVSLQVGFFCKLDGRVASGCFL